jgi:DNA-binding protein HU-beta
MKMNIDQLSREIAADHDLGHGKTREIVRGIFAAITENMAEGHEITIPDFGKFRVKSRPEREGRNPKTGETMTISAKTAPNFLAAKGLKEAVNQ